MKVFLDKDVEDLLTKPSRFSRIFPFSIQDLLVTACTLFCAVELCILLRIVDPSGEFASLIFVLAVFLISRLTHGYLFGLIASVVSVVGVNYIFTYPYLALNFSIAGYPLTFLTMLVVSIITCTMTTQIKEQEHLKTENEKEKTRANLLRSVSHDIRTPLTSIVGVTSTLLENADKLGQSEKRQLLEDARDEAQWLIRVVENLLSITRMGNEQAEIEKKPEAAEEVLGEAARKFRKRFPAISIAVQAPDNLLMVPMDAILIEQVISNLLENAVIHGETTTQVRLSVQHDGKNARFCVADDGRGIPEKDLPTLFNGMLKRSDTESIDGKRNMGLGLTVCKAIVHAHGGTMEARNCPEGGAEFTFKLPLSVEAKA
jgi:two-component system sensor histidine kinase KdpD